LGRLARNEGNILDTKLIRRITLDKLNNAETYWIAGIVGTLINGYGQLLVPWFRGADNAFKAMGEEFSARPALMIFSIFLAYAFPLFVGVISSVITRYKNRRTESIADFLEKKPDPVFRAARDGKLVEIGTATADFFDKYGVRTTQMILGDAIWSEIVSLGAPGGGRKIRFDAESQNYLVSFAPTQNDEFNIYMTRVPAD